MKTLRSQILTCFIFVVLFKKKSWFHSRRQPFRKIVVIVEEELDGIDTDDIGNLGDSPRFVFIDEECENLIVVNDGGEPKEEVRHFTITYIDVHYVTNAVGESISSVTM